MTERLRALAVGGRRLHRAGAAGGRRRGRVQRDPAQSDLPFGIALRFARIARDPRGQGPDQATTLEELRALYERQFATKGRAGKTP